MKNIKLKFGIIALLALFTACDNAIDIEPKDEIVESNALLTVSDIEDATIGVYAAISGTNIISWNSRISDNHRKGVGNRGQGVQVHSWSINSSTGEPAGIWNNMYSVNNRLSRILDVIDNIPTESSSEIATLKSLKGELLVIRAMTHFDLARFFTKSYTNGSDLSVPYIDFPVVLEKPARNTLSEVYSRVEEDLTAASSLLDGSNDNIFVTKELITALKARIDLYKGTEDSYTSAINNATTVISKFPLATLIDFPNVWTDNSDLEVIFKLKREPGNGSVGTLFTDTNGDIFFSPSDELVSLYSNNDIRKVVYFSTDLQEVIKYPGTSSNYGLNDIKLFRVSEQYLIRAEAYALKGDLVNAAKDYNKLRQNRISAYTDETFTTKVDALNKIALERRRELAFEGHRFFDLKRTGLPIDRLPVDCEPNPNACDLPASDYRFTLPIPQTEIFANENMVQNEGYTTN